MRGVSDDGLRPMSIPGFLRPKLVGKRFEENSIPLELLGDLAVLEAMIIEVAKGRKLVRRRKPPARSYGEDLRQTS